jgi:hypothetical protein
VCQRAHLQNNEETVIMDATVDNAAYLLTALKALESLHDI